METLETPETLALVPEPTTAPPGGSNGQAAGDASAAAPRTRHARLRVVLVADSHLQPRWTIDAFSSAALADWADMVAVVAGAAESQRPPRRWRAYQRMERWLSGRFVDGDPDSMRDIRHLGRRFVTVNNGDEKVWRREATRLMPDVIFLLGDDAFRARLAPVLANATRFGVWVFRFGSGPSFAQHLAGVAELAAREPVETSSLTALMPDGSERVLSQSWTRTMLFSVSGNRRRLLRRTGLYPRRALRDLVDQGPAWFNEQPQCIGNPVPSTATSIQAPALLPTAARIAGRALMRSLQKMAYVDQWFLAYRFGGEAGQGRQDDWGRFTCLMPPKDRFWADPFPIQWGGRYLIFFEELPFASGRAHISVMEVAEDGTLSAPRPVLMREYHLSYPFLFEAEGRLFMIPETGQNGTVELYSCQRIPDQWRLEKVLLQGAHYVDASIHRADGRWWMFVNVDDDINNLHDELHLYYADHFLGPWHAHRSNPVKSDVRGARSAGRLFEDGGKLHRPAQICAPLYGSGISLNQVQVLSPERYAEQEVGRILPPRGSRVLGIHTLNRAGRLTVVDGFMRRRRFGNDDLSHFEPERLLPDLLPGQGAEVQS